MTVLIEFEKWLTKLYKDSPEIVELSDDIMSPYTFIFPSYTKILAAKKLLIFLYNNNIRNLNYCYNTYNQLIIYFDYLTNKHVFEILTEGNIIYTNNTLMIAAPSIFNDTKYKEYNDIIDAIYK